jgi:integrase/recombinase XerD
MTALRQRLIEDLQLRNFSAHTVEAYVRDVAHFSRRFGRSPEQLSGEQVREYLLYMVRERRVSWSLYNQTRCALQLFYRVTPPHRHLEPAAGVRRSPERFHRLSGILRHGLIGLEFH